MFTGLIEFLSIVRGVESDGIGRRLVIAEPSLATTVKTGDSIAVNGACLTVVEHSADCLHFQVGPETLLRTCLGELQAGDRVNLERPLRVGERLDGHLVQGHADGQGRLAQRIPHGDWQTVRFTGPGELVAQMAPKGSVAVDGVSLTVVDVDADGFTVALIPHTLAHTTLGFKPLGSRVNLETDVLAKYVWKYMQTRAGAPTEGPWA